MAAGREYSRPAALALKWSYVALFALSSSLIAPFAHGRSGIWIVPKLWALGALILLIAVHALKARRTIIGRTTFGSVRYAALALFAFGICAAIVSGRLGQWRVILLGHPEYGDGLIYWLLLATLVLANSVLLTANPGWLQPQAVGVVLGSALQAIAVTIQRFDWTVDFTATSGQLAVEGLDLLSSSIFAIQMPIGLARHRGIAGACIALGSIAWYLIAKGDRPRRWYLALHGVCLVGLCLVGTRAPIVAGVAGVIAAIYVNRSRLGRRSKRLSYIGFVALSFTVGVVLDQSTPLYRNVPNLSQGIERFSSGRLHMWKVAIWGVSASPLGWGYDGFSQAYIEHAVETTGSVGSIRQTQYEFALISEQGELQRVVLPAGKAHNLVLDAGLHAGLPGIILYIAAHTIGILGLLRSRAWTALIVAVAFLAFGAVWYDVVGVSHIAWWAYSLGVVPMVGARRTLSTGGWHVPAQTPDFGVPKLT